jgi:hypothetical protein
VSCLHSKRAEFANFLNEYDKIVAENLGPVAHIPRKGNSGEEEFYFMFGWWPTQARCWPEWGCSRVTDLGQQTN